MQSLNISTSETTVHFLTLREIMQHCNAQSTDPYTTVLAEKLRYHLPGLKDDQSCLVTPELVSGLKPLVEQPSVVLARFVPTEFLHS